MSDLGTPGLTPGGSSFRIATWNAHSVYNKRLEMEALLHTQGLDILCVTESWLRPGDVWEVPSFMSYRSNRPEGQGGGRAGLGQQVVSGF